MLTKQDLELIRDVVREEIEIVNKKLDTKVDKADLQITFEKFLETLDELNSRMDKRVSRLEDHCDVR